MKYEEARSFLQGRFAAVIFDSARPDASDRAVWKAFQVRLEGALGAKVGATPAALRKKIEGSWGDSSPLPVHLPKPPLLLEMLAHPDGRFEGADALALARWLFSRPEMLEELFIAVAMRQEEFAKRFDLRLGTPAWAPVAEAFRASALRRSAAASPASSKEAAAPATVSRPAASPEPSLGWIFARFAGLTTALALAAKTAWSRHPRAWTAGALAGLLLGGALLVTAVANRDDGTRPRVMAWRLEPGMSLNLVKTGRLTLHEADNPSQSFQQRYWASVKGRAMKDGALACDAEFQSFAKSEGQGVPVLDEVAVGRFGLEANGAYRMEPSERYPNLRSLPSFPAEPVGPGSKWDAPFEYRIDEGTREPFSVGSRASYVWLSNATWSNRPAAVIQIRIDAEATNAGARLHDEVAHVAVRNEAWLWWSLDEGHPLAMVERQNEEWTWGTGRKVRFSGTWASRYDVTRPLAKSELNRIDGEVKKAIPDATKAESWADAEGVHIRMKDILFDFNSDRLRDESRAVLDAIRPILARYPGYEIHVAGHSDGSGGTAYNELLSERRARTVATYLGQGLGEAKLAARGYGARRPIADNGNAEGRQKNRRVEILLRQSGAEKGL